MQSEPVTEAANLPSSLSSALSDPATDLNMVSTILTDLQKRWPAQRHVANQRGHGHLAVTV